MHLHAKYLSNNLTTSLISLYRALGPTYAFAEYASNNLITLSLSLIIGLLALPMHLHAKYLLNNLTTPLIGIYRAFGPTHALTECLHLSNNLISTHS